MQKNLEKLVRRWLVLVILVLLGGGAGALHAVLTAPTYQASTVVIATTTQPSGDDRAVGFAQAYGRLAGQQDIAASAAGAAKMPVSQARDALQTTTSPDSPMIEIVGSADTPDKSADLVNAAANAIVDVAGTRVNDTGVRLIVLSPAVPPDQPTAPVLGVNIAVGAACGFLLGGLFVLGRGERRPSARSGAAGTGPVPPGGTPGWPADGVARAGSPGRGPAAVPRPPAPAPPWNGRGRPRQPDPRARPAAPPGTFVPPPGTSAPAPGSPVPATGSSVPAPGSPVPAPGTSAPAPGSSAQPSGTSVPPSGMSAPASGSSVPPSGLFAPAAGSPAYVSPVPGAAGSGSEDEPNSTEQMVSRNGSGPGPQTGS